MSINGAGAAQTIIDGGGDALKSRIFDISGPIQVEISGMTMQNGRPGQTGSGGGIFISSSGNSVVTLSNDIISGCYSYAAGGIAVGSNLNLISTTLINNRSTVAGGLLAGTGSVITITNSAIISNVSTGSNAGGGGLTLAGGAAAAIKRSVIAGNTSASDGGGIYSNAALIIEDSTISDNTTTLSGGGMYIESGLTTLRNVTIAENIADGDQSSFGGGIYIIGYPVSLINSIVARNRASGQAPDCSGVLASQDYNLIQQLSGCTLTGVLTHTITGSDPLLGPLQNNGGGTWTRALLPGSPAIDAGDNSACEPTDQRGLARPYDSLGHGAICDIGAYEAHFIARYSFLPVIQR